MLKKILSNTFLKVFSYNSLVVFGKLFSSFIISKISAIYLGPSGYAIVGNFKNLLQGILGVSATGFQSGIIKYIAESKEDSKKLDLIIATVIGMCMSISLILGSCLLCFSNFLSVFILKDASLAYVIKYLGVCLPFVSLNFVIIYILNGLQKFKLYTVIVTITNLFNALFTVLLIYYFSLKGALIASVIIPILTFIVSLTFKEIRDYLLKVFINIKNVSVVFLKSISTYLIMATYSSILISLAYLFIRNKIILDFNSQTAGLWEAVNKISAFYMVFFSSLFTLYLLPKLSVNKTVLGYSKIMKTYFIYIIPFACVLFVTMFLLRSLLIQIFLTNEFESIEQFFHLQFIGDFIKIIAFSLAYQFHAKKMVAFYFISDFVLYISFYILSLYFIKIFKLEGVFYAYILSTILYLMVVSVFIYFKNETYLKRNDQKN